MRILFVIPLLLTAACNVQNDPQNNQVVLEYDEERIENTVEDIGNTAEDIGEAIGNEAESAANRVTDGNTAEPANEQ